MAYKKLYPVPITDHAINMMMEIGRLQWPQKHDPLAVGQAMHQLLTDWAASGKTMKEFVDEEKRLQRRKQEGLADP